MTYATAEYRPTPVVEKRYFESLQQEFIKDLIQEPQKLGLGSCGSGGRQGLSALEGYAAALEVRSSALVQVTKSSYVTQLYDYFLANRTVPKDTGNDGLSCHIIHISATKADDLVNPMWNQTSVLDHITWKTLPEELQKVFRCV